MTRELDPRQFALLAALEYIDGHNLIGCCPACFGLCDASDCRALLSALGLDRVHLVRLSYSGAVALQLAADSPADVHTLTLLEPSPVHVLSGPEFRAANERLIVTRRERGVAAALEEFLTLIIGANRGALSSPVRLIEPFPRRQRRGLPRRVWRVDRAQGGQQRLPVEGDIEAAEQADQGERAFNRMVPGDPEQVQPPVDAVLPGLGGDQ